MYPVGLPVIHPLEFDISGIQVEICIIFLENIHFLSLHSGDYI